MRPRGAGKRPSVVVPSGGLIVAVDRVRFENVDFVWKHPAAAGAIIAAPRRPRRVSRLHVPGGDRRGRPGGHRLDPSGR